METTLESSIPIESTDTTAVIDTAYASADSLYQAIVGLTQSADALRGFGWVFMGFFATVTCGLYLIKSTFKGYA